MARTFEIFSAAELIEPKLPQDGCGHRCRDFDEDCEDVTDKFHCWKYDPEQGVCPYLTGEIK